MAFGPRPPRLVRLLYPVGALFLVAALVRARALLAAVLLLDGGVLVAIGVAAMRNAAGMADELMAYAHEISLTGPRRFRPGGGFPRLWGAVAALIGVAWLAGGVATIF